MLLAGDIGGTKTRLALFRIKGKRLTLQRQGKFPSKAYPGIIALLKDFLSPKVSITAACFGVAGPVANGRCEGTNLPWIIDAGLIRRTFRCGRTSLINDLEATAYGIERLPSSAFLTLQKGRPVKGGTVAVIAAGTGLGEAALVWEGGRYQAVASEGGHTDFAPRNDMEIKLWRYLAGKFGHVSYERILSGPGKLDLYYFLRDLKGAREPGWLAQALRRGDPSAVVSEMALRKRSPVCVEALGLFASIYGAEAGNWALKMLARGGVYVGGGIAPTLLPILKNGAFMEAFLEKGRLSSLLSEVPVKVILDDRAALFGAAHYARHVAHP